MTAIPDQHLRRYSLAEYLTFEEGTEAKHEFHNGQILAMSGASPAHALINANAIRAMGNALEGSPCRVYSSDLKIYVQATDRVSYPDASIVCGPLQFYPRDEKQRLVTNPRVIVEVLSPTTEAYDRGEKFRDYRELASFEEYVLISQVEPVVETFVRQADGRWVIAGTYSGIDRVAMIACLNVELKLSQIYAGIIFGPKPLPPDPRERPGFEDL